MACLICTAQYSEIAPGLKSKKKRDWIQQTMDNLIKRASLETGCPENKIEYVIVDNFTSGRTKKQYLPKTIMLKACGQKLTYLHSISYRASDYGWKTGTWILNVTSK